MATNEAHVLEAYWYNVALALGAPVLAAADGGADSPNVMTAATTARTKIRRIRGASLERLPRIACVVRSYPGSTDVAIAAPTCTMRWLFTALREYADAETIPDSWPLDRRALMKDGPLL
jgi:hypothetical protein